MNETNTSVAALILVVEDDPDQQNILQMVFKSEGYQVCLATDGKHGLEVARTKKPDLIVSDLMMPNLDGAGLLTAIRADELLKRIPVLILTVVSDAEKEYQLLDMGADDYCEKNVQRKILLKRIENLLRRSRAT